MKKNRKIYDLLILLFILILIVFGGCSFPITREIKYEVNGTVPMADITYKNFTEGTDKLTDVELPWSKTFSVTIEANRSFVANLTATNRTKGSLTASIYVNDILVKTSTDSGSTQYVYVSEYIDNY